MSTIPIYVRGRKVAILRNGGTLCDIRRRSRGFLYNPTHRVAVNEELLAQLNDNVILQVTNEDSGDRWTCTVGDFRRWGKPVQFADFEKQVAVETAQMNHVKKGGKVKPRKNEPLHIEAVPIAATWKQMSFEG